MTRLRTIGIGLIIGSLVLAGRSQAEVDPNTILGAWLLDEGQGSTTKDASRKGHDGTLRGSPRWVTGPFGGALEFSGSGTYVDCGNAETLNVKLFSVSFWCNVTAIQGWNHIISRGQHAASGTPGSVNWGVMMYDAQARILFETYNNTGWTGINTNTTVGEWHHLVATYDGDRMQLYHDGTSAATSGSGIGILLDPSRRFLMGARSDAGSQGAYFNGKVDEVGFFHAILSPADIATIMNQGLVAVLGGMPEATDPNPASGATDVPSDSTLAWTAGMFAATHDVYLGTSPTDVQSAGRNSPQGVLVSQGQTDARYSPPAPLEYGRTYYWRVDAVNAPPDATVFKGPVWSFTVEPYAYPVQPIVATASSFQANMEPSKTIDGSGLMGDLHGTDSTTMWLSSGGPPHWIRYEFDQAYRLYEMRVWNSNQMVESLLGFGAKSVTIETSVDGATWTPVAEVPEFARAPGLDSYAANTTVRFGDVDAKFVKLTINSHWGDIAPPTGLSEVRFSAIPVRARAPQPADAATNVSVETTLDWRPGRKAASHTVYFGTDPNAVADGAVAPKTVTRHSYTPDSLDYGTTYYWRVDEVNAATYPGQVWSFATEEYLLLDDFESYTDQEDGLIYEVWRDGSTDKSSGAVVGLWEPINGTYGETTIIHGGKQSMPVAYDNTAAPYYSEATLTFEPPQDWTAHGIKSLSLWFRGVAGNAGQLYVKINGTKVLYDGAAADLTRPTWQVWNLDLAKAGNVKSVRSLVIGIEGAGAKGTLYFDDIRLYPKTPQYVTPVDPGSAGLVALYTFDGNARDTSGNRFDGTVSGTATYGAGVSGQAIVLNGANSFVSVTGVGITGAASRTISGWAKASRLGITAWTNVFGFTGPSASNNHFDIEAVGDSGTTSTLGYYGLHRYNWERDIIPIDLEWHHLAATYDGTTARWYGDGMFVGSAAVPPADVLTPGAVNMGKRQDNTNFFPGSLDEVRIYNRALSAEEIAGLTGLTKPLAKPF